MISGVRDIFGAFTNSVALGPALNDTNKTCLLKTLGSPTRTSNVWGALEVVQTPNDVDCTTENGIIYRFNQQKH